MTGQPLALLARLMASSPAHDWVQVSLSVEGVAPLLQSAHILSIALVMGSIVMIDLRVLGLAGKEQSVEEMMRRLAPFLVTALLILLFSGSVFVFLRPTRYFANPFFLSKMVFLAAAMVLAVAQFFLYRRSDSGPFGAWGSAKIVAAVSLLLWIGVVVCGRWIAYYFPH